MSPLFVVLRQRWPTLVFSGLLVSVSGALPAVLIALVHELSLSFQGGERTFVLLAAIAALAITHGLLLVFRTFVTKRLSFSIAKELRRRAHLQDLVCGSTAPHGVRLSQLFEQVDRVQLAISALVTVVRNPITILSILFVILRLAPLVFLVLLAALPAVLLVSWITQKLISKATLQVVSGRANLMALASEHLKAGVRILQWGVVEVESAHFEALNEADERNRLRLDLLRLFPKLATGAVALVTASLVFWLLASGQSNMAQWAAATSSIILLYRPIQKLVEVVSMWTRAKQSLKGVALLRSPEVVEERAQPSEPLPLGVDVVVGWSEPVVHAKFTLKPGEFAVLSGPSGAGKSTFLRSLFGEAQRFQGQALINGLPLNLGAVAFVRQDSYLFNRTVLENLRLGAPSQADLKRACAQACCSELFAFAERVGEGGQLLSGGQRQRVALARALARQPGLLFIDEGCSQVDTTRRLQIIRNLKSSGITVLWASHDEALLEFCTLHLALKDGQILPCR